MEGTITILPGASLQVFVRSGTILLKGNGFRNETGYAGNFGIWGMPAVTDVSVTGSGTFVGTIYAPHARMILAGTGGGRNFIGAVVANNVDASGSYQLHYDEALQNTGMRNLTVVSWKEI
jgi:hypothetical protein